MKKYISLLFFQAFLSVVCGILITKMSFLGRIGVHTIYREYLVFRSWWKTALLLWAAQFVLILILVLCKRLTSVTITRLVSSGLLIAGFFGLYLTYINFTTTSHKLMKAHFHWGFYLFWAGWFVSCLVFLFIRKSAPKRITPEQQNEFVKKEEKININH